MGAGPTERESGMASVTVERDGVAGQFSARCDGQLLVAADMLGLFERTPRFVRRFDDLAARIGDAAARYAGEVRARSFPGEAEIYAPKD